MAIIQNLPFLHVDVREINLVGIGAHATTYPVKITVDYDLYKLKYKDMLKWSDPNDFGIVRKEPKHSFTTHVHYHVLPTMSKDLIYTISTYPERYNGDLRYIIPLNEVWQLRKLGVMLEDNTIEHIDLQCMTLNQSVLKFANS